MQNKESESYWDVLAAVLKPFLIALLLFALFVVSSCACTHSGARAERDTFEAISDEYLELAEASGRFDEEQMQRRRAVIAVWDARTHAQLEQATSGERSQDVARRAEE